MFKDSEHAWHSSESGNSRSSSSNGGTISGGEGIEERRRIKQHSQMENYWDMTTEQEKYYTDQFLTLNSDLSGLVNNYIAHNAHIKNTKCY